MASKTVTISPAAAAAAGCTATCESIREDASPPSYEILYYQLAAAAAAGWEFVDFSWTLHWENSTTGGSGDTPATNTSNPYSNDLTLFEGWVDWAALEVGPGRDVYSLVGLTATFRRPQPTPTHLLVNSSTVESPAKLVYDPATNLLVADY